MLKGKVMLITGGNSGIGYEASILLARQGSEVVIACRNPQKAERARKEIVQKAKCETDSQVKFVQLDLSDLSNVKSFRERYEEAMGKDRKLDVLIMNAGVMALAKRQYTKEGIEMQIGTNVVGHYALMAVMFDLVAKGDGGRMIFVSSGLHHDAKTMDFGDFKGEKKKYNKWQSYAESKLGNLLLMNKMIRVMHEKGMGDRVLALGCHPGVSITNLANDLPNPAKTMFKGIGRALLNSNATAADSEYLAATDANAKPGGYAGPRYAEVWGTSRWGNVLSKPAQDEKLQDKLWEKCKELTGMDVVV